MAKNGPNKKLSGPKNGLRLDKKSNVFRIEAIFAQDRSK